MYHFKISSLNDAYLQYLLLCIMNNNGIWKKIKKYGIWKKIKEREIYTRLLSLHSHSLKNFYSLNRLILYRFL